ncbi:zinc ribbon domain-containing protein [Aneurinibacillus uraniidurans]|uniref:zinc ribbon domain-containing protein n=1 Tax=Aneurinibacillus uraniidurans TaxID=2966586 RepID=UPI00234AD09B|nr:zinc ribbon domain-containing protein [Aneurinibacillus sp. B1]WCN37963.1 zinc ribbon domain-containing protein [Aneurinibacillus sp. B1]
MSDLQHKLGDSLTKIKGGINQGKQKLQAVQESSELRKKVNESLSKKAEILLKIGQEAHFLFRQGELENTEIQKLSESLIEIDRVLFETVKKIEDLNQNTQTFVCECGAHLSSHDKFCGSCGRKIILPTIESSGETTTCDTCENLVPIEDSYCGCCGTKVQR